MSNKSPNIDMPKGGGALKGMGETFSADLFTGTGNFSIPIAVPSGRNGFQPELTLGYSTGNGSSPFGLGWNLSIPGIMRKTARGVPVYDDEKDIFILSGAEDLVKVKREREVVDGIIHTKDFYRPRTEGLFARIIHHKKSTGENYWEVRSKDGLVSYYGTPGALPEDDGAIISKPRNRSAIFSWKLSQTIDLFGNRILYSYFRDLHTNGVRDYDQLFLDTIRYMDYGDPANNDFLFSVNFEYTDRPDPYSDRKAGFEIRTTKRCDRIRLKSHPNPADLPEGYDPEHYEQEAGIEIKHYELSYIDNYIKGGQLAFEQPINKSSVLAAIQVYAQCPEGDESLPPIEFKYSNFNPNTRALKKIEGELPPYSLSNPNYELVDIMGNGLPDIIEISEVVRYWRNLGNGKFDFPRFMKDSPAGFQLADPEVQLIDANGDSRVDLLVQKPGISGYFGMRFGGLWDRKSFHKYEYAPSFSFADPEVKLMDIDGDGVTDVLRNGARFECFFNDPVKGFYKTTTVQKKEQSDFPNVSFADPRVRTSDMSGDGLQDIVLIHERSIEYWPNLGYGNFAKKVIMRNSPRLPFNFNPARVLLGDIDGDGLTDLMYVDTDRVLLWINQSGNSWSDMIEIKGTPFTSDLDAVRIVDLNGSGVAGLLWSFDKSNLRRHQMYFLDFTGGNKPYLLQEMNNNMGSITKTQYRSSIEYYLEHEKKSDTRWKTPLPFPVLVVSRVEVIDEISKGKLTTEYEYFHGYWDGVEREFRGFGRVEQMDTETFRRYNAEGLAGYEPFEHVALEQFSPPVLSKSWFYQGPMGDEYGGWYEQDYSDEYWQNDPSVLKRPVKMTLEMKNLPRRAYRDALRTMRGTTVRSELYALDGSITQIRPYTVTENMPGVRLEYIPPGGVNKDTFRYASGYIFFPLSVGQRSSQWERGSEPMTSFGFTEDYDDFGQAKQQISIACPKGMLPPYTTPPNDTKYLATFSEGSFIYKGSLHEDDGIFMVNRNKEGKSYDCTDDASMGVIEFKAAILNNQTSKDLISHSLNFYDGDAFTGLAFGQIGDYGVLTRSESLVITDGIIAAAYSSTPECFETTPDWSSYPSEFQSLLQNGDARLGYLDKRSSGAPYEAGFYVQAGMTEYDFQDISVDFPKGLIQKARDTFENTSSIEYDDYELLPIKVTDPLGMETIAEYDYRVIQPSKVTDPNANISVFHFTPIGMVDATAIIGKGTEGDYKASSGDFFDRYDPSVKLEYNFFNFKDNKDPVWVKTIQREYHHQQSINNNTIVSVMYSDGFGREIQTRNQAEDVIYGDAQFGDSGLPANQSENENAVGIERDALDPLNVVVSGWQLYNNKGLVVEKYEPFFAQGFDYLPPDTAQYGKKVKMYYDPRGQVIRTLNPNESESLVIYGIPNALDTPKKYAPTPWVSYTYDANDNAGRRSLGPGNTAASNFNTPKSAEIDPLGRTIKTTEHNAHYNGSSYENVVMQYEYDIRGNLTKVIDALGRTAFEHIYDLANQNLWTEHIDGGQITSLYDAGGKSIESIDTKGAITLSSYDELNRPIRAWAKNKAAEGLTLRSILIYGDNAGLTDPETDNLKGQLYRNYDESGLLEMLAYDFKGNLLNKSRRVISSATLKAELDNYNHFIVDWTGLPSILDSFAFETGTDYDALNRLMSILLPEDVNTQRKEIIPEYNRAGALNKVFYDSTAYVNEIAYNAKGQRLLIAFGNDVMTRYAYHPDTFRLSRQRSEKYTRTQVGNTITFAYNSGTNRQDDAFDYDLIGNIVETLTRVTDCGISGSALGSDALNRNFEYDPLYRVIYGNGRESDTQSGNSYLYADAPAPGTPNANNVRVYERNYAYDKMGNIKSVVQSGSNGFTRAFTYNTGKNTLQKVENATPSIIEDFTYDTCGNQTLAGTNRNYVWDHANRLLSYYNQAGGGDPSVFTQYDYSGHDRISKLVRTGTAGSPIYERTIYIDGIFEYHILENGSTYEKNYVHIMDNRSRIAEIRLGTPFPSDLSDAVVYNLEDQIGSSVTRLNTSGAVIDKEEYYPFGDSSLRTFSSKRYRYVGKEKDQESGLYYYGARYYAAWTCRFISVDPLAAKYNYWSSYVYAGNNPIMLVDINGEGPDGGGDKSASVEGSGGGSNSVGHTDNSGTGSIQINGIKATQEGADIYMRSFENTLGDINPFHYDKEKGSIVYDNNKLENAKNIATCTQLEIIDATVLLIESDDSSINVVDWNEELSIFKDENNTLEKREKIAETVTKYEEGKFVGADIYIARDAQIPTGNIEQIFDGIDENGQPKYKKGNEKYRGITEHELSVAALHEIYHPYIHFIKPELSIILGHEEHNLLVEDFENRIREIYKTGNKIVTRRIKNYGKIKYSIPTYIGGKALSHSKLPNEK